MASIRLGNRVGGGAGRGTGATFVRTVRDVEMSDFNQEVPVRWLRTPCRQRSPIANAASAVAAIAAGFQRVPRLARYRSVTLEKRVSSFEKASSGSPGCRILGAARAGG